MSVIKGWLKVAGEGKYNEGEMKAERGREREKESWVRDQCQLQLVGVKIENFFH